MKKFITKSFVNMLGFYLASMLFPAISVSSLEAVFKAGLLLGAINLFIRPLLLLISLPINFVTLGFFTLIINTWMVMLAANLVNGIVIPSFLLAFATTFLISVFNIALDHTLND